MLDPRSRLEMVSFWKATAPEVLSQTWWRRPSRLMGSTAEHKGLSGRGTAVRHALQGVPRLDWHAGMGEGYMLVVFGATHRQPCPGR